MQSVYREIRTVYVYDLNDHVSDVSVSKVSSVLCVSAMKIYGTNSGCTVCGMGWHMNQEALDRKR